MITIFDTDNVLFKTSTDIHFIQVVYLFFYLNVGLDTELGLCKRILVDPMAHSTHVFNLSVSPLLSGLV